MGRTNGQVFVYDLEGSRRTATFWFSGLPVRSLAFGESRCRLPTSPATGPDSDPPWLIAAGDTGGSIGIYDTALRRVTMALRGAYHEIECVAFSPDGMTLASGGRGPVRLWDLAMGRPLLDLDKADYCKALVFSADGHRLAAIGVDWQIGVWDTQLARLLWLFQGPQGESVDNYGIAFSPDSKLLAVSTGSEAQLWDLSTGRRVMSWPLPTGMCDVIAPPSSNAL